jgi:hypothetical protein
MADDEGWPPAFQGGDEGGEETPFPHGALIQPSYKEGQEDDCEREEAMQEKVKHAALLFWGV